MPSRETPIPSNEAHVVREQKYRAFSEISSLCVAGNTQELLRGHQPVGEGERSGFGPAMRVGLAVDLRDMALDRPDAQNQLRRYVGVALARPQEAKHLYFPFGKAGRVRRGPRRRGLNLCQPFVYPLHQRAHTQFGGDRERLLQQRKCF